MCGEHVKFVGSSVLRRRYAKLSIGITCWPQVELDDIEK